MDSKNNSNDHWAFLEEIEAPMWVDLTLEVNSNSHHIDDDWFFRSHLFHQCSSRQLKAAFSRSGEDFTALNYDLVRPSSPKLPSSVSKSRGKDFVSKKWIGDNPSFSLDKGQAENVLCGTSCCGNFGSSDEMKPISSSMHLKATSSSKSSSISKSCLTGNNVRNCCNPISVCGDPTCSLSSRTNKADESSTTSTIASESGQQQQWKFTEKSNQAFSQANGLFSFIKTGMRRNGVTRPASRVETNGDRRQSRGRKSSSGKSSVGSSSYPRSDGRSSTSTSIQCKENTLDCGTVERMTHAAKNRIKTSKVSNTCTHKIGQGTSNHKTGLNVVKSVHLEAAKPKIQYQTLRRKPLEPVRVFEKKSITTTVKSKEKAVVCGSNRLAASGKENLKGRMVPSHKYNSKGVAATSVVWSPKGTKRSILQRNDRTGLIGKGKIGGQSHPLRLKNVPKRPFR